MAAQRDGGPFQVLLLASSTQLRDTLCAIVQERPDAQVIGRFETVAELLEWLAWTHYRWDHAFVDLELFAGTGEAILRQLVTRRDAGRVVALTDDATPATRERCAALGMDDVLDKRDLAAFRDYVERRLE